MKTRTFGICAMLAIGLAAPALKAQESATLVGVWDVNVTVKNCETGALIRTVNSIQYFHSDQSQTETANTASRGPSYGSWQSAGGNVYHATYWFYRYTPTGTFASEALVNDVITLVNNNKFTSKGTVQDFDDTGKTLSIGCFRSYREPAALTGAPNISEMKFNRMVSAGERSNLETGRVLLRDEMTSVRKIVPGSHRDSRIERSVGDKSQFAHRDSHADSALMDGLPAVRKLHHFG